MSESIEITNTILVKKPRVSRRSKAVVQHADGDAPALDEMKKTTNKPKRIATDGTATVRKTRKKKTDVDEPMSALKSDVIDTKVSSVDELTDGIHSMQLSSSQIETLEAQSVRVKREKVSDLEKRIKSMKKRALTQSVAIDRRYTNEPSEQMEELTFDRDVDAQFDKMYEYKEYIINYDRLRKLPTFDMSFKTVIVDEDLHATKPRGRAKKGKVASKVDKVEDVEDLDEHEDVHCSSVERKHADIDHDGDHEDTDWTDWKQDLKTMVIRNQLVRVDDDKGLVYNSQYELIGTIEEFEEQDDEDTEATEGDAVVEE
jgi:hypothetical protein